jgi:hypothetical protein
MNTVKCLVCGHEAKQAGVYVGSLSPVTIYQCSNPQCVDGSGNPIHMGVRYEFDVQSSIVLDNNVFLRFGLKPEFRYWNRGFKR